MSDISTVDVAKKQRHLYLLQQVQQNKPLSKVELDELEQYEMAARQKPQTESKPAESKKTRGRKARRRSLSEADCQRLGYSCKDIAEADAQSGIGPNLAKYFERHPRLRKAFDRGRLLRYLIELAPVAMVHDAAKRLKDLGFEAFAKGQDLRDFLDNDAEANELWETARVNGWIEVRDALRKAAQEGNGRAISYMEKWAIDRQREEGQGGDVSFARVSMAQMCDLFGVSRQTLHEWTTTKNLTRNLDGSFDLARTIKWFEDYTVKKTARGKEAVGDKLRDLKAERMEIELSQRRGQLVDRDEVFNGLAQRLRNLAKEFDGKKNQIARILHGQTVERISDILSRFFEDDLLRSQLNLPEFIQLPAEAMAKLAECLSLCGIKEATDAADKPMDDGR